MPIVTVDENTCIGCEGCVNACPQTVLVIKDGKAFVAKPNDCIGCRACESVCPVGAITVKD